MFPSRIFALFLRFWCISVFEGKQIVWWIFSACHSFLWRERAFTFNWCTSYAKFKIDFIRQSEWASEAIPFQTAQFNRNALASVVMGARSSYLDLNSFNQNLLYQRHTLAPFDFSHTFCIDVQTLATNFLHRIISSLNDCLASSTLCSLCVNLNGTLHIGPVNSFTFQLESNIMCGEKQLAKSKAQARLSMNSSMLLQQPRKTSNSLSIIRIYAFASSVSLFLFAFSKCISQ